MEPKYHSAANGQELQQQDVDSIAEQAALADDRLLWELLRLTPQSATPQKGILTYGKSGWAAEGALGQILGDLFRASRFPCIYGFASFRITHIDQRVAES